MHSSEKLLDEVIVGIAAVTMHAETDVSPVLQDALGVGACVNRHRKTLQSIQIIQELINWYHIESMNKHNVNLPEKDGCQHRQCTKRACLKNKK